MSLIAIPWHPPRKDLQVFAGLQWLFCAIVAVMLWRRQVAAEVIAVLLALSSIVAVVGLVRPAWIRPVYVGWMLAVFPIGWVVSHTVLVVVYFGVITPIGWLLRWRGHDPLQRRRDPAAVSYWIPRPPPPDPQRYFRQF